jgi:membrane protein implicated in regulation of membrane protease activity
MSSHHPVRIAVVLSLFLLVLGALLGIAALTNAWLAPLRQLALFSALAGALVLAVTALVTPRSRVPHDLDGCPR